MAVFGELDRALGDTWRTLASDEMRGARYEMPRRGYLGHISAFLGATGTLGAQQLRAAVYNEDLTELLATSDIVEVTSDDDDAWVPFALEDPPLLEAGDYYLSIHSGTVAGVARLRVRAGAGTGYSDADTFADGPLAGPGLGGVTTNTDQALIFGHYRDILTDEEEAVEDLILARRGWWSTQETLARTGVEPRSLLTATCGWHGENFDPEVGAFAIVRTDGPLADLVGERLRVEYGEQVAYVYCHDERDIVEDISLTRRAFMALDGAYRTSIEVNVEVMQ